MKHSFVTFRTGRTAVFLSIDDTEDLGVLVSADLIPQVSGVMKWQNWKSRPPTIAELNEALRLKRDFEMKRVEERAMQTQWEAERPERERRERERQEAEQKAVDEFNRRRESGELRTRREWLTLGFRVPKKFAKEPAHVGTIRIHGYGVKPVYYVTKEQVLEVDQEKSAKRRQAARKAADTCTKNMIEKMETVEIDIKRGVSDREIYELAIATYGGNYLGDPGEFRWSKRAARNCIRHNLTNYEQLWSICNRGETGSEAYEILRERVDDLIDEVYPQFIDNGDDYLPIPTRTQRSEGSSSDSSTG